MVRNGPSLSALLVLLCSITFVQSRTLPPKRYSFTPRDASPGFQCTYPSGWQSCNSQNDRSCWVKDPSGKTYDINTDYDTETPTGIERTFNIDLTETTISPDGYTKPLAKVANGNYPGPLIEACWGDTIIVNVKNNLPDNGTTIHWHGLRQLNSNTMDGVNGVTQCPVAQGDTFTYRIKLTQYGHTWYHSHYSLQYADGVAGPLLIHGPHSADWDEEWTKPVMITDWVHDSAFREYEHELNGPPLPIAHSILVDGQGIYDCDSSDPQCVGGGSIFNRTFQPGKRYLIRLINASAGTHFVFSIDNHVLQVVSNDMVAIKPYNTTALSIGIGQRYSVIVEAKPTDPTSDGNYWIRTEFSTTCNNGISGANSQDQQRTGMIRYNANSTALPKSTRYDFTPSCDDESQSQSTVPVVPWKVTSPQNNITNNTYEAGLDLSQKFNGYFRWDLTDRPMWLDWSNPTILNLKNTTWDPAYAVVDYDYNRGFVFMVIVASKLFANPNKVTGATHPIHLHGHDFAIVGQSTNAWDPNSSPSSFNFDNPPRRDVAMLPSGGYLAIAFKPDNPGAWLVHCHIAWHASSGLALQILERQGEIEKTVGSLDAQRAGCDGWKSWLSGHKDVFDPAVNQDDSGV